MTSYERAFYRLRVVMTLILSSTPFCFLCMDELVYSVSLFILEARSIQYEVTNQAVRNA